MPHPFEARIIYNSDGSVNLFWGECVATIVGGSIYFVDNATMQGVRMDTIQAVDVSWAVRWRGRC